MNGEIKQGHPTPSLGIPVRRRFCNRQTPVIPVTCVCPYVMSQCALPAPRSYVLSELITPMLSLLRRMRKAFTHTSNNWGSLDERQLEKIVVRILDEF